MMKKLLIVESPAKAKTISKWLYKKGFKVFATAGHIKNLPKDEYGIELDSNANYVGKWELMGDKKQTVNNLKQLIAEASNGVYIGTDDDKEGERIAYDIVEHFKLKEFYRILFHEVTEEAILTAIDNSDSIDEFKVNSQIARRIIDREVGYPISSAIKNHLIKINFKVVDDEYKNKQILNKLGIGRVSAASLGVIVRNERKIEEFEPEAYNRLFLKYIYKDIPFTVANDLRFKEEHFEELATIYNILNNKLIEHTVYDYKLLVEDVSPYPPLITSRLLRNCNYLFNIKTKDTMKILQKLYEGVELFEGDEKERVGLITYIRTDSFNIADSAVESIIDILLSTQEEFIPRENVLTEKRVFKQKKVKKKSKNQAHEAIRPTKFDKKYFPKNIKRYLEPIEYKIYEFIYYRTLSTQLKNSRYDRSKVLIKIGDFEFKAQANFRTYAGWEVLDGNKQKKAEQSEDDFLEHEIKLPTFDISDVLSPLSVDIASRMEKKPPRIGEGRFITILENNHIGKPSTVPTIVDGLEKNYLVIVDNNFVVPTELGKKVYSILEEKCNWLIDLEHAKKFEDSLSAIEDGEDYNPLIAEYEVLKEDFLKEMGFEYSCSVKGKPEDWQIEKAQNLSKKYNLPLPSSALENKKNIMNFINKALKANSLGKCPSCKKDVYEYEKMYKCSNRACDFTIWKNSMENFFNNFEKFYNPGMLKEVISHILKHKKLYIRDLHSKNKNKTFAAYIKIEKNKEFKNYQMSLSFPKNKDTEIDEKYKLDESIGISDEIEGLVNTNEFVESDSIKDEEIVEEVKYASTDIIENCISSYYEENEYFKVNLSFAVIISKNKSFNDIFKIKEVEKILGKENKYFVIADNEFVIVSKENLAKLQVLLMKINSLFDVDDTFSVLTSSNNLNPLELYSKASSSIDFNIRINTLREEKSIEW